MYTNLLTSDFTSFYLWQICFAGTCCLMLSLKVFKQENTVSGRNFLWVRGRGEGFFASNVFGRGSFLPRAFFHRHLSFHFGDCWRLCHGLICEGDFAKATYNPGVVVTEAFVLGAFESGCVVTCEIYKRSKYVEVIPHVENLSICHITYGLNG